MAVDSTSAGAHPSHPAVPEEPIDIEAWTADAAQALGAIHITPPAARPAARGATVMLDIPLDDHVIPRAQSGENGDTTAAQAVRSGYTRRREPLRRDSLKRREALLKGKEGSRQRRRWENDRLLNNPHAQPPLPSDWEVRPQYQFHYVPYSVASYWDKELAARNAARNTKGMKPAVSKEEEAAADALKELRERLKKKRAARNMLEDIEREVRKFVEKWEDKVRKDEQEGVVDPDSEDEQIVFVGRNGQMSDMRTAEEELRKDLMVFDSLVGDRSAAFGRWLVHSIAAYYGLETWSVTTGTPAKREAYIGIKENKMKTGHRNAASRKPLPQPLWSIV
ncbi:UV-damaged DNA-binding protein [Neofusicoccum parvum]|uniref:UV-damaged DNA-binding protein n=1 Tax=Neofusicoccum parvum TaxID=310453 RepID=A0ACB5SJ22_9PEZI|nr:UV-damaged DNA-binding protein [Neofusicoccum parvum]